jgi:hypothetical protein
MRMNSFVTKRAAFLSLLKDTNGTVKQARKVKVLTRREFTCNKIAKRNKLPQDKCKPGYYNSFWQDHMKAGRIEIDDNSIPRVTAIGVTYINDNKK